MKWQADKGRKEAEVQKVGDKIMLSIKDLVFKEQPAKKLADQYISPYIINKVVSTNAVKLQLPTSMRIHLVVNISQLLLFYMIEIDNYKYLEQQLSPGNLILFSQIFQR